MQITHHFSAFNDFFEWSFDLDDEMAVYITNIYNFDGMYTAQEPGLANNIGVPWVLKQILKRDLVYESFCTIVESCHANDQYEEFCHAAIGKQKMNEIKAYFSQDVFDVTEHDI